MQLLCCNACTLARVAHVSTCNLAAVSLHDYGQVFIVYAVSNIALLFCTTDFSCYICVNTHCVQVSLPLLWESMQAIDPATNAPRGFILVQRSEAWGGMMHGKIGFGFTS